MTSFMSGVGEMFNYAFNSLDMTSSANDIIVIQHADGTLHGSPFTIRFGKVKVLRPQDKVVTIEVNGKPTTAIMKIASDGTAYWLRPGASLSGGNPESPLDSPMPQSPVVAPDSPFIHGVQADVIPPVMDTVEVRTPNAMPAVPPRASPATAPAPTAAQHNSGSNTKSDSEFKTPYDGGHDGGHFPSDPPVPPVVRLLDADHLLTTEPTNAIGGILQSLATEAAVSTPKTGAACPPHNASNPAAAMSDTEQDAAPAFGTGGGLRLARLASTDNLDAIPLASVSLRGHPANADDASVPRTAAEYLHQEQQQDRANSAGSHSSTATPPLATAATSSSAAASMPTAKHVDPAAAVCDEYSNSDDDDDVVASYNSRSSIHTVGSAVDSSLGLHPIEGHGGSFGDAPPTARRSIFASHHDLMRLNLKPGANTIKFSTGTTLRGKVDITANIFLWSETAKLVVSDIDGTVTKSDVMGHIATFFGKDWTHPGLCALFSKIEKNGYHFVYLTARSVSQVDATRQFLFNVEQEGERLPFGPVLTAPDKLFSALTQELSKKSHEFKITCLAQVRDAFPASIKPFYAGFGNRIGDVVAYTASEISQHKIFIINKDSVIHIASVKRSYRDLSHMVDETFPARRKDSDYLFEWYERRGAGETLGGGSASSGPRSASPGSDSSNSVRASPIHAASAVPSTAAGGAVVVPPMRSSSTLLSTNEVEAEFNSFNFWRVDPRDIAAPPAPPASTHAPAAGAATSGAASPASSPPSGAHGASSPPGTGGTAAEKRRWQFWKR